MHDTIVALATPLGAGALGVIRLSGPACLQIFSAAWQGRDLQQIPARHASLGWIVDGKGQRIDQVVITRYAAPASFTGLDCIEICCHGGSLIARLIIERLVELGARPAAAGEFSQQAFLNGKLDLTQAEAIMDMIAARSQTALRAAQQQLEGSIGKRMHALSSSLLHVIAHIEAHIDFPDEDISPDSRELLLGKLDELIATIRQLGASAETKKLLREGIPTAIVGVPNAGKSSLLNLLLGYERAIVSDIEGTTRDTIEELLVIDGIALRLIDTAGVRHATEQIEQFGIQRSLKAIEQAQFIIEVIDASQAAPQQQQLHQSIRRRLEEEGSDCLYLAVLNKVDCGLHSDYADHQGLQLNCLQAENGAKIHQAISTQLQQHYSDWNGEIIAVNARHQHALGEALQQLQLAREQFFANYDLELVVVELYEAMEQLGSITGKVERDDILGAIFAQFCIGK